MTWTTSSYAFIRTQKLPLLVALTCVVLYIVFAYNLERSDFIKLITLIVGLFFLTHHLINQFGYNFWMLAGLGVFFRVVFFPAIPNLSQDFYRFIWDGRLLVQGVNPYSITPLSYLTDLSTALEVTSGKTVAEAVTLFNGMGDLNASHYSNYPPINQFCFVIASFFAGKSIVGSVMVLRVLIISADIGILYVGKKILAHLNLPVNNIFWYFLNPFIIIELTGNLHFEGVMLFFVVWAFYLLFKGKWIWAAVWLGLSISVKLIPLLFLPLFLHYFRINKKLPKATSDLTAPNRSLGLLKLIIFYIVILGTAILTFIPFISPEFISNFAATIGLWFQNFEFNASIYYIVRWIGYQVVGWNIIGTAGKVLPLITLTIILLLSFFRKNHTQQQLITAILFAVSIYFLLSTTVHPWYIATPLLLSVFTTYRFPVVWSAAVMLSYAAYGKEGFDENLWLVAAEYIIVIAFAITEILSKKGMKKGNFRIVEN